MTAKTHVRLDKLSTENEGYLPTGYYAKGHLVSDVEVGKCIWMARYERARQSADEPAVVTCGGEFTSSPVAEIIAQADGSVVCRTANSHWRVTILPESA